MSDNYAVINGKRVELTDEQVKALGIKRKNPFERANPDADDKYYYIRVSGDVADYHDVNDNGDRLLYEASNYFNDEQFAEQVALHQLLYRKLLKFAYDNECEDTAEWNGANEHWLIIYHKLDDDFTIVNMEAAKELSVYFSTEEGASRAITEVIRPFMKEHPDFVW
jgi:hypothetical protein